MTWLLDVVPPDYLLHGVLRRHPVALAALARHHLGACVEGARNGYRTARTELGPHLPPSAIEAVLTAYRSEGSRLAAAARAADLIERALHGEEFVPNMGGGARAAGPGRAGRSGTGRRQPAAGVAGTDVRAADVTAADIAVADVRDPEPDRAPTRPRPGRQPAARRPQADRTAPR